MHSIALDVFDRIAEDLRAAVPPTAVVPGEEQIFHPSTQKVIIKTTSVQSTSQF